IKEYVRKRCEDFKDNPSHMINSLIDCHKRKIIINRVLINNNNNQELLVNPVQIKEATIHHFQTCAGGINMRKEIPQQWQQQYSPKSNINPDIYNTLMDLPSLNEWYNIIKNLPNDKAAGPSGITNKMIKYLDWNSDLSNTCPITLLETICKAMVRIINDRLMKIMVEHKILKEDAKEQKKEIWLLFQDLSKAYDRVNIFMLEKAFKRLHLPSNFITLILNLFSNHKNRVFTAAGTTNLFDMLIEERKLGYNIRHNYKQNLYSDQFIQIEQHLSVLAFMDDTSWITESKQNLELILSIADSFYQLNNIMVNKQKSELLVKIPNNKDIYNNEVDLNFGNEQIKIQPKKYSESIRILGIWMNLGKKRNFIIQQAKDEVIELCNIMKKKLITDKQLLYIYNTVIIPRIEYRTQLTFLIKKECDNISSPFRQLFKHKINLSTSAPNAIVNNRMIYNYRNLYEVQLQFKITNFYIQLNDQKLLGNITDIRLKQIQHNEWLCKSPLIEWPYNTPQYQ
ncbi:9435_t:CDS:2, partial [Entrophospora sp. SA101]